CSQVMHNLVGNLKLLSLIPGQDYDVIDISIDPHETAEMAAQKKAVYVNEFGRPETANGWHFLTGAEPAIQSITTATGFNYVKDEHNGQYIHASGILIISPKGIVSQYFLGVDFP